MARLRCTAVGVLLALASALWQAAPAVAQAFAVATTQISVTPNSAAYSAGQCLGGVLTVPAMVKPQGRGGTMLVGISLVDPQHQSAANDAVNVLLFNAAPSGTYTDHANCNVAAGDVSKLIGFVQLASTSCIQDQAPNTTVCAAALAAPFTPASLPNTSSSVWAVPIVTGTPTYGAAATLYFNFMAQPFPGF